MDVFSLFAKIGLDTSDYERGLDKAKKSNAEYKSDVMKLAQTYKSQGMNMSDAMKKAYSEIDKSQYETASTAEKSSKSFSHSWGLAGSSVDSLADKLKTGLATAAKAGAAALTAASAAVGVLTKQSLDGYSEYEQLVGGVETLFKDSADIVMGYANNAYQTAGLSANQYMETVTSFSASLLQSLGGDTQVAAEYADMAIRDMSDNANKMGTAMDSIQNAYQGFAKQNYTMLDNLKLGYGGTQAEMARLINDSGVLGGTMKVTAETVNQVSFDKMIEAIHVVQTEIGITGTTAAEASSTIQGSVSAAESAWENLVAGIGNENADLDQLVSNLVTSAETAAGNILPRVTQILTGMGSAIEQLAPVISAEIPALITSILPSMVSGGAQLLTGLATGLISAAPGVISSVPSIVASISGSFSENWPAIQEAGSQLLSVLSAGIRGGLPTLRDTALEAVSGFGSYISENLPVLVQSGLSLIGGFSASLRENAGILVDSALELAKNIAVGIAGSIPTIIEQVPAIVSNIAGVINDNGPKVLSAGINIIITLGAGLIQAIPTLIENIPQIITAIVDVITAFQWIDLGKNIIKFLANGIKSMAGFVANSAKNIRETIIGAIKDLPKTLFELGKSIFTNFGDAISSMKEWVISKAAGIASSIIATLKKLPGQALQIGKDLLTGLWNGILDKVEWLKSQVLGVVNTIKSWFTGTDGFDEHSPSKWSQGVAEFVMQGLGIGFENGKGGVMETVEDIIGEVKSRFDEVSNFFSAKSDVSDLEYQLWERTDGKWASDTTKYAKKLEMLTSQQVDQASVVEAAEAAYQAVVEQYGLASEESYKYQKALLQEKMAYQDLLDSILQVQNAKAEDFIAQEAQRFQTGYVDYSESALGTATAALINTGYTTPQEFAFKANMNLVAPDGKVMASYMFDDLIAYANANGTPIINPTR